MSPVSIHARTPKSPTYLDNGGPLDHRPRPPWIYATLMGLIALVLTGLGGWLASLGGSLYYVITGVVLLASAYLLMRGRRAGAWLYGAMLVGTLAWSIWEVGFDGWALAPRLIGPAVFGLWLLAPSVKRSLD